LTSPLNNNPDLSENLRQSEIEFLNNNSELVNKSRSNINKNEIDNSFNKKREMEI
jgi:hypothetical protein